MTDEEILETVARHYMIGNDWLTTAQWGEHKTRGSCDQLARAASRVVARELETLAP